MYLFGITGLKFSGKSTVAKFIRRNGVPVINWDSMYHSMIEPGSFVHKKIIQTIGDPVINIDGTINIYKLGMLMYKEFWIKTYFDELMLECSKDAIERLINAFNYNNVAVAGIDSGIFLEGNLLEYLDSCILVTSSYEDIKSRLLLKFDEKFAMVCLNTDIKTQIQEHTYDYHIVNNNLNKLEEDCKTTIKHMIDYINK